MAPILTIFGLERSRRRDLFLDKIRVAVDGSIDGSITIEQRIDHDRSIILRRLDTSTRRCVDASTRRHRFAHTGVYPTPNVT